MEQFNLLGTGVIWVGLVVTMFFGACLYFSLTYFEQLKKEDDNFRQSKWFAVISLVLALAVPAVYQLYVFNQMTNINSFFE